VDLAGCWRLDGKTWHRYRVPCHHLMLVEYGTVTFKTPDGEFTASAGDLLCFRPASGNEFSTQGATLFYQLHVAFAPPPRHRATPLLPGVGLLPIRLATGDAFDAIRRVFEVLCMELDRPGIIHQLRAKAQIYELLALLSSIATGDAREADEPEPRAPRANGAPAPRMDAWERLKLRIEEQALREGAAPLAVSRMAREIGVSQEHFSRQFHARFGLSPRACHTRARLSEATRLLRATDVAVKRIAFSLGFADGKGLCRAMARHMGITPTSLRRNRDVPAPATADAPAAESARLYSINRHILPPGAGQQWSRRFKVEYRLS
jgi:AraC-like DNA-binding protein